MRISSGPLKLSEPTATNSSGFITVCDSAAEQVSCGCREPKADPPEACTVRSNRVLYEKHDSSSSSWKTFLARPDGLYLPGCPGDLGLASSDAPNLEKPQGVLPCPLDPQWDTREDKRTNERTIRFPAGAATVLLSFQDFPAEKARDAAGPKLFFSPSAVARTPTPRPVQASRALPKEPTLEVPFPGSQGCLGSMYNPSIPATCHLEHERPAKECPGLLEYELRPQTPFW